MGFGKVRIIGGNGQAFLIAGMSLNNSNDFNGVQKTKIARAIILAFVIFLIVKITKRWGME